ncbi:ADP-ribosylation factor 4 [Armadillidium vulgare]|nr:ADP-ribosylation factor 4 [Armadillidium vulgare]
MKVKDNDICECPLSSTTPQNSTLLCEVIPKNCQQMIHHIVLRNCHYLLNIFTQWYIQATCAAQGQGLYEGLDWLSTELSKKKFCKKKKKKKYALKLLTKITSWIRRATFSPFSLNMVLSVYYKNTNRILRHFGMTFK